MDNSDIELAEKKKKMLQRCFSRMDQGSLRGSIFALMSATLGAGILSMPYMLRISGYFSGTLLILIGAGVSFISNVLLFHCHAKTNIGSYSELVETYLGPFWGRFLEFITVFTGSTASTGYIVIFATNIRQMASDFLLGKETTEQFWFWCLIIFILFLLLLPLVLKKQIDDLRYFNSIGVAAAIYPAFLMVFLVPFFAQNSFYPRDYTAFKWDLNVLKSFSISLFAYTCQLIVIQVKMEIKNPTEIRLVKVFNFSF